MTGRYRLDRCSGFRRSGIGSLMCLFAVFSQAAFPQPFTQRLHRLECMPLETRRSEVDAFFRDRPGWTSPIIEDSLSHFIFICDSVESVQVAGDFNQWNPLQGMMRRVSGTGFHYLTRTFEMDARLDYKFVLDGSNWILDPRNPHTCMGGFGPNSELAMPGYRPPGEIRFDPALPHGRVDTLMFRGTAETTGRSVFVYLPPSYAEQTQRRFPALIVNDGRETLTLGSMSDVLDNLIGAGRIPELIAVFVDPVDRNREYRLNPEYKRLLALELVPWIDEKFRTVREPAGRGIWGVSLGGLTALEVASTYPEVFGLCASQSGAFWVDEAAIVECVRTARLKNTKMYLDWGSYEPSITAIHERMADILESRGCKVSARVWHEGHSWGSWRAHADEALVFLFQQQ